MLSRDAGIHLSNVTAKNKTVPKTVHDVAKKVNIVRHSVAAIALTDPA